MGIVLGNTLTCIDKPKITIVILNNIFDINSWKIVFLQKGFPITRKLSCNMAVYAISIIGLYPYVLFWIFEQLEDGITYYRRSVFRVILKFSYFITIISVKARHGTYPKKSVAVF